MRRSVTVMLSVITLVMSLSASAAEIPLAFLAKGGIGKGSFEMDGINESSFRKFPG